MSHAIGADYGALAVCVSGVRPVGATVYFITPSTANVVKSPVTVKFVLKGIGVAPAGVDYSKTGQHHLLIDIVKLPPMETSIPADANHKHFGGGQTETTAELAPGTHTLQLLLGDMNHIPQDPPILSVKITITVK